MSNVIKLDHMARNAIDVAKKIVSLSDPEKGDLMSNLKLQKLLYYSQGFHLAIHNKPLFHEDIYAWSYGPVVKEVYHYFKKYGSGHIPVEDVDKVDLSVEEEDLIFEVWNVYGQFSALKLMELTHNEPPWFTTEIDQIISHKKMKAYFLTQINEN